MKLIQLNQGKWSTNTSGVRGVSWDKKSKKWKASFHREGVRVHLGFFSTVVEAESALQKVNPVKETLQWAIVSDEDFEYANQFSWHIATYGYAVRNVIVEGKKKQSYLHREILERMGHDMNGRLGDHRDLNVLNNQRNNLRVANSSQNGCNRLPTRASTSGVKGVSFDKRSGKWAAYITVHYRKVWSRLFPTVAEAAAARAEMLPLYHGEFARC